MGGPRFLFLIDIILPESIRFRITKGIAVMKIKVSEIPEEGLDVDEQTAVRLNEHETQASVSFHIDKRGPQVLVKGKVEAGMRLTCSRCLQEFVRDVSMPVDLVYNPVEDMEEEHGAIGKKELDMGFYRADEIDTGVIASEQILLNVPIKVLCSEACKGICPRCGRDLNVEGCICPSGDAAPPSKFDELKKYFEGNKNGNRKN